VASGCALSQAEAIHYFLDNFHHDLAVLILEDDVETADGFNSCFEIPDDADCIY
jgi:GR25 family glycosyltransferase involved in LPS biosynthesis